MDLREWCLHRGKGAWFLLAESWGQNDVARSGVGWREHAPRERSSTQRALALTVCHHSAPNILPPSFCQQFEVAKLPFRLRLWTCASGVCIGKRGVVFVGRIMGGQNDVARSGVGWREHAPLELSSTQRALALPACHHSARCSRLPNCRLGCGFGLVRVVFASGKRGVVLVGRIIGAERCCAVGCWVEGACPS